MDPRTIVKPSEATLLIQHKKIQRDVEKAINEIDTTPNEDPTMNKDDLRKCLMNLSYLHAL